MAAVAGHEFETPDAKRPREVSTDEKKTGKTEEEREKEYQAKKDAEEAEAQERDKVYQEKMAEVDKQHNLMVECLDAASKANHEKDFAKMKELRAQAEEHKRLKEEAKNAGLQFMFDRANKNSDGTWVDLHGLQVEFALLKTSEFLDQAMDDGKADAKVIWGAGHHSGPGGPLIKPKIQDLLKKYGLTYEEVNDGEATVKLPSERPAKRMKTMHEEELHPQGADDWKAEVDKQHNLMVEGYEEASKAHDAKDFARMKEMKGQAEEHKKTEDGGEGEGEG